MDARSQIEEMETALRAAMLASDVDAIRALLADSAIFTTQDGVRLSKADDLAAHQSGMLKIAAMDAKGEPIVLDLGDCAVVCVTMDLAGTYADQPFSGTFAYSRVWRRDGERWRIEAAHCSAVAG